MAWSKKRKKKKYGNGGEIMPPDYGAMSTVMTARNKNLPWVARASNPNAPKIRRNGDEITHRLAYGTGDNGTGVVFPTVVQQGDSLVEMNMGDAMNYARENNTFMEFPSAKFAKYYSENGLINHNMKKKKYGGKLKYKYGGKMKYANGGPFGTPPQGLGYEEFGINMPVEPIASRRAQTVPTTRSLMTEMGGDPFTPDYFTGQTKKVGGTPVADNYDYSFGTIPQDSLYSKGDSAPASGGAGAPYYGGPNRKTQGDGSNLVRGLGAIAGPAAMSLAAGQYNFPDMDVNYTPVVPEEVRFDRESSQIQEDTRTFDTAIQRNTSSTPIAAAMMTARRGQAARERAQLGQTRENMNVQNRFQADVYNQRADLQTETINANNRKERAIMENERTQKYVDSTQQLAQNIGVMAREKKMDARDKARFRFQFGASAPETQNWILFNAMDGAGDADIRELADITGFSEARLKAIHKYVANGIGPEEAARRASEVKRYENFDIDGITEEK